MRVRVEGKQRERGREAYLVGDESEQHGGRADPQPGEEAVDVVS